MRPFVPFFRNPHLLTIAGNFWPRAIDEARFPAREVLYPTEPGTRVLVHENRPEGTALGEVFLVHGLEGSSRSGYMVSMAQTLLEAGFAVHRLNIRSCGGTEDLTDTLYHSGLTQDLRIILERFRAGGRGPRFVIGYSLGGNLSLKLTGELGEAGRDLIAGVCAVSTPIDLHACVRRLDSRENWIYQQRFVRSLRDRYQRRHQARPDLFPLDGLNGARTVFEFDDRITARAFGFGDAANYYATQSSMRFLNTIQLPVFMVQAKDDPLIPFGLFESDLIGKHQWIQLLATDHGGHLGFIARTRPRFWLDGVLLDWIRARRNNGPCRTV